MKYLNFFLVCLSCFGFKPTERNLVWSDEFNYEGIPDPKKWNYETGNGCPKNCGWGNNETQIYSSDKSNVFVEKGLLVITAVKKDNTWTSGKLTTKAKADFTYGRIEFSAKLPAGKGGWPALWMLGDSFSSAGWPACGEIDVMEHVGRDLGIVQSVIHSPSSYGNTVNLGRTPVKTFDKEFHIYAVDWKKDRIEFYVDDINFYTYKPTEKNDKTWPFDKPFYIIMNIAVGGNLGGPTDPALSQIKMEVDYVRVFQ